MAILKTYKISEDVDGEAVDINRLDLEIRQSGHVENFKGIAVNGDDIPVAGDSIINESALDQIVTDHTATPLPTNEYKIQDDVEGSIADKPVISIDYKKELKSGVSYTPKFFIHYSGINAGLLEKTEYYKDYVDENDEGELVLVVEETYTIDDSDQTIPHSAKPAQERDKKWKHVRKLDDQVEDDESKIKTKNKKYNTRKKRHNEGKRRRDNILEQLIDHVGLGGILSGVFSDPSDAYNKLTEMQELHANAFDSWMNSGRGSLYDDVAADTDTTWLDTEVPNNATTQAQCPWMMGLTFRDYIVEKLKGNVK